MVIAVAKKKPMTDRRATRNVPVSREELVEIGLRLEKSGGAIRALCLEMQELGWDELQIAGRHSLLDATEEVANIVKQMKGRIEAEKFDLS